LLFAPLPPKNEDEEFPLLLPVPLPLDLNELSFDALDDLLEEDPELLSFVDEVGLFAENEPLEPV